MQTKWEPPNVENPKTGDKMKNLEDSLDRLIDKFEPAAEKMEDKLCSWIDRGINWWETREERKKDNPPEENPDDF